MVLNKQESTNWLELAKDKLNNCELQSALDLATQAVENNPKDSEGYRFLAHLYAHFYQDYATAFNRLNQGIKLEPDDYRSYQLLGDFYTGTGQLSQAIKAYQQALRLKGDDHKVLTSLGEAYLAIGERAKGMQYLRDALTENPLSTRANRRLRYLAVQDGNYRKAFDLWKLDNVIKEYEVPIGTIAEDLFRLKDAVLAVEKDPSPANLCALGDSYFQAALHEDALVVYQKILTDQPEHEAKAKSEILQEYLAVISEYQRISDKIYRQRILEDKYLPHVHRQMLYDVLYRLSHLFAELRELGPRATKKTWLSITRFYEEKFRLHIKSFLYYKRTQMYGTYAGYLVNERYHLINRDHNQGRLVLREVANDVETSLMSWAGRYFDCELGGWIAKLGGKEVYRCTDHFKDLTHCWRAVSDPAFRAIWEARLDQEVNSGRHGTADIFYCESLRKVMEIRTAEFIFEQVRTEAAGNNLKEEFFRRCYEVKMQCSLIMHESSQVLMDTGVRSFIRFYVDAKLSRLGDCEAAAHFRSKLLEIINSETPFMPLSSAMSRDLSADGSYGRASVRLFEKLVKHILDNSQQYQTIDFSKNILLQLTKLTAADIKAIAKSLNGK